MNFLPIIKHLCSAILTEPGDEINAKITKTGKQVLKIRTSEINKTIVKHPTGSVVEYNSYKDDK